MLLRKEAEEKEMIPFALRRLKKRGVRRGALGGEGTMSSVQSCVSHAHKKLRQGVPYSRVAKQVNIVGVWNKRKNPKTARIARTCAAELRREHGNR